MSTIPLIETLKNTIEAINEIYEVQTPGVQWITFLKFSWNVILDWILYIGTFQWLNDFVRFSINIPKEAESIFADLVNNFFNNPYPQKLDLFLDKTTELNTQAFFGISFFYGFFNCFFLYFPLSPSQFIWLRRVIIDGEWAGRAATIGIICGHLSLLGSCLFGFRTLINTWFGIEPLSYFLGIWLIFFVIFEMTHSPFRILKKHKKKELLKIFLINFSLVWTDQSGFYQFFGNLSLQSGISPLDFTLYNSQISIILYFCGIIFGSFFWTFAISNIILHFGYYFPRFTNYPYSFWIRGVNHFCLIGCITLTITSFPYYGTDYLFTNLLGFKSQDNIFETLTLPKLKANTKDVAKGRMGEKSSFASIDTDLSLFDRGQYAGGPIVEFHIESLNYQEEYAWRSRFDKLSSRSLNKGGGLFNQYLTTQLGPVEDALKKQRREKKRAQQMKKIKKLITKNEWLDSDSLNKKSSQLTKTKYDLSNLFVSTNLNKKSNSQLNLSSRFVLPSNPNFAKLLFYYENIIERFIEDYTAEANTEDSVVPDLVDEKMIHFSAFSEIAKYGFDLFSMFEALEFDPVDEEVAKEIKEKFSENLIYRFLVNFDISSFLKRQIPKQRLTTKDEISLFEKRLALGEYYDTLRNYSALPIKKIFQPLFGGPKSYSNRIYNQQFKGTLKIVERLFSIHLEDEKNIPELPNPDPDSFIVPENPENRTKEEEQQQLYFKLQKEPSVLKFDQPLYKDTFLKSNPLIHEQFMEYSAKATQDADSIPFIKEGQPLPFFVGWDNEKRKFVITNRLLTRQKIFKNVFVIKDDFSKFRKTLNASKENIQDFTFTTWPVTAKALQKNPYLSRLFQTREDTLKKGSGDDLFKYSEPFMEEDSIIYDKLPTLVNRVELKNPEKLQTFLKPVRGGWVWPGNSQLKYKIMIPSQVQNIFKNWNFLNLERKRN
uniref:Ycf1 n=1 Tax=Pseudochlorodesmis sp. HV01306c TaxID=2358490 RepID=A0A386AYD7_9CHLO|nr:hypothetical protein Ycf1 [Pseudochlorodesmis sp. HV01306c]